MKKLKRFTINETVKQLLSEDPALRDSDAKLVVRIWRQELKDSGEFFSLTVFFSLYEAGKITSADSITRCRRKLQEELPSLRGDSYAVRQHIEQPAAQEEVRQLAAAM